MGKDTISEIITAIFLFLVLVTLFPIAAQKIFESILTGIIIGVVAGIVILGIWLYLQHH